MLFNLTMFMAELNEFQYPLGTYIILKDIS